MLRRLLVPVCCLSLASAWAEPAAGDAGAGAKPQEAAGPFAQPPSAFSPQPGVTPTLPNDGARLAEPEIPRSEPPDFAGDELNLGWTLARTMLVLALVVGLAWLTLNVGLRKLLGIRPTAGTHLVNVLERVPLDQKRSLFVIEAAGEILLVGGSDVSLTLIAKLDRAEVDKLRAASPPQAIQLSPFLQKLLGRKDSPPPPAT